MPYVRGRANELKSKIRANEEGDPIMAEYYFDYTMKVMKNELNISVDRQPKLYFERDYSTENVSYIMYMTFPQWNATNTDKSLRSAVGFSQARIIYDIGAVSMHKVLDVTDERMATKNEVEIYERITFDEYMAEGHRFVFPKRGENYSGVGKIILNNGAKETVYIFAVNFGFKRIIRYKITNNLISFEACQGPKDFNIVITSSAKEKGALYPGLKSMQSARHEDIKRINTLEKGKDFNLGNRGPTYISFDPNDEEMNAHYLLECTENSTLEKPKEIIRPDAEKFCPYCHTTLENKAELISKSQRGGIGCDRRRFMSENKKLIPVLEGKYRKKYSKNAFYCSQDFTAIENGLRFPDEEGDFLRILPEKFFEHEHFKVVVVGSKRAGKTTLISRLFGVTGDGQDTGVLATSLKHATNKVARISPYLINSLKIVKETDGEKIITTKDSWYKKKADFYSGYSIDINKGKYPSATNAEGNTHDVDKKRDMTKLPFIMEIDKKSYVYFYDMAGEDAQRSAELLKTLVADSAQPVAIFCLIDSKAAKDDTKNVFNCINSALEDRKTNCHIAVILTKFDTVEEEFDESCHCLRSDVHDMTPRKIYEHSELETNINLSSEEIRTFLSTKGINPEFEPRFNVKYFGVSAFSTKDSIFHEKQKGKTEEINYLLHTSSPKRMELPFIWALKQFGCIY